MRLPACGSPIELDDDTGQARMRPAIANISQRLVQQNSFLRIALLQVGQLLKQLPLSLAKVLGQAYLYLHK